MRDSIVVTASAGTFSRLAKALGDLPVTVQERPLVSFEPILDWTQLDAALGQGSRYRALALTSPRAAQAVADRVRASGISWNEATSPTVWAVGAGTAAVLQGALGTVRVPGGAAGDDAASGAAALAHAMVRARAQGPVLFPCGEKRRKELPRILRANGIEVHEVVCYRTVLASQTDARAAAADSTVLVVASPSVVELLAQAVPSSARPLLVAVGPTTAASARDAGWTPAAVASTPSTEALASVISGLLATR